MYYVLCIMLYCIFVLLFLLLLCSVEVVSTTHTYSVPLLFHPDALNRIVTTFFLIVHIPRINIYY